MELNWYFCEKLFDIYVWWSDVKVTQSCLTLCDHMDCTVYGILQARILEWVAIPFFRRSSQPRDQTQVSSIVSRFFTNWSMREALMVCMLCYIYVYILCICILCIYVWYVNGIYILFPLLYVSLPLYQYNAIMITVAIF